MAESTKSTSAKDGGEKQVDQAVQEAEEKGYIGETPDETPNRNYTVAGVIEGAPTPETTRGESK